MQQTNQRLRSIDIFRAVTMLFMIFVNDVSGVVNIPTWIEHVEASEDGLGFADTVFPAFLFIVGLSVPIAIKKKVGKGRLLVAGKPLHSHQVIGVDNNGLLSRES